jgi:predicted MPP superfamily phosphohydrolase
LLAGDIADHSTEPIIRQNMAEEFRSIKSKFGVFAVSGNHEYFSENPYQLQKYLESAGVTYLRDSVVLVDNSLYVVGRDDKINPNRASLNAILKDVDDSKSIILMDHQPFKLEEAVQNKVDLQVSGHTHNGQFFPGNLIVKKMYEVAHGYLKKENTHFYVSSGLGIWGPQYRIGTQSELVVIDFEL